MLTAQRDDAISLLNNADARILQLTLECERLRGVGCPIKWRRSDVIVKAPSEGRCLRREDEIFKQSLPILERKLLQGPADSLGGLILSVQ